MFGEEKNLKSIGHDMAISPEASLQSMSLIVSSQKLNKLVTAVYIVTDIMDKDEPIRLKLRTLVVEILSDIQSISRTKLNEKVQAILSLLDIASAINLISDMNFNILKKEFLQISESINDSDKTTPTWLEDFLLSGAEISEQEKDQNASRIFTNKGHFIGHSKNKQKVIANIGVQKGGTLLKAISDKTSLLSDNNNLKNERRQDIIKSIKDNGGSATITDIKNRASGTLASCGEKTLQRELISMTKDGVLNKTGEKRWSKYFLLQN